ncbi:MAG: hypothetical protein ACE14V_08765 [bacterium]
MSVNVWSITLERQPNIGYVYPAGGQLGTSFQIKVGGQFLNGVDTAYVSGTGISAKVVQYYRPLSNMQKQELRRRLNEIRQNRLSPNMPPKVVQLTADTTTTKTEIDRVDLPDYPQFHDMESLSPKELRKLADEFLNINKNQQPKESIAETVLIEVTIDSTAIPGDRDIRIKTPNGLSNPIRFQVGVLPERSLEEPFEPAGVGALLRTDPVLVEIPATINGQLKAGQVNRCQFNAKQGQHLVISAQARSLIPYLADAVPGWFQVVLTLYDEGSTELISADHYRYAADPVLFYVIPKDGMYTLEIRDSIYRGREDFIYRVSIGEEPYITGLYPLGGQVGKVTYSRITGWNLAKPQIIFNTNPGAELIRQTTFRYQSEVSNQIRYAVDTLPEMNEFERNDNIKLAQRITIPKIINGRISNPGDIDMFRFDGHAGEDIILEVKARRLGSPLDSLVRIFNTKGRMLSWNDDYNDQESGLITHHADSYLKYRLPEEGTYYVQIADAQHQGGEEFSYRLRISSPQPDYALRVTPSSINISAGRTALLTVYAVRKDGYTGDIEIKLKDAPDGFKLSGGIIPAGQDRIRLTLTAPMQGYGETTAISLEGMAWINEQQVLRPVVPAEDMMQAFAYRHLVPEQNLMVTILHAKRRIIPAELASTDKVLLSAGGTVQVVYRVPPRVSLADIRLQLDEPPNGIILRDVVNEQGNLTLILAADGKLANPGLRENLIVEAFAEYERKDGKNAGAKQRTSLGILPAIPIQVMK